MFQIKKILRALFCLVLVNVDARAVFDTAPPSADPVSATPTAAISQAPTTAAPASPGTTLSPSSQSTSAAPSIHATTTPPSNVASAAPSSGVSTSAPITTPPQPHSSPPPSPSTSAPSKEYNPPSLSPSSSMEPSLSPSPRRKGRGGAIRVIGKTIGWLILISLSTLAFGAIMSNRYRIYYFTRGIWYSLLSLDCTRRLVTLLRLDGGGPAGSASLNEIIFDQNDLAEGLLMGDQ